MPRFFNLNKGHSCQHCRRHPYAQLGRLVAHVKKHHPDKWAVDLLAMDEDASSVGDVSTRESTPAPLTEEGLKLVEYAANYQRLLIGLTRPLTSLETRLKTTNQVDEEDYDSEQEDGENDLGETDPTQPQPSQATATATATPPAGTHVVEFPSEITVIGCDMSNQSFDRETIWRPFKSGYEFKLARWFMDNMVSKRAIDLFFNDGLARVPPPSMDGSEGECFTSAYTLCNILDDLDPDLAPSSWKPWAVDHQGAGLIEFRYRSVEKMIRHIFKQQSHAPYMVYKPVREYTGPDEEYRLYSELHTAEWWWKMQKLIPDGHFLIPLIFGSDETFQTNFSGDKNIWPMTMAVGNMPAKFRNKILTAAWRLIALLPIRPKRASKQNVDDEKTSALETVQMVLNHVLKELQPLWENGMEITCPDGKVRIGHPVIAGWLGDYPEYCKLFTQSYMSCNTCVTPRLQMEQHSKEPIIHRNVDLDELRLKVKDYGEAQATKAQHKRTAQEHIDAKLKMETLERWFNLERLRIVDNLLFRQPHATPRSLWKPDLLHTMDLGMVKHACEWMFNMLDEHGKGLPDLYDITWMSISPHPEIFIPKKKYRAVKQWSGKEYRNASSIMLAVLEAALDPYPATFEQQEIFDKSLDCLSGLLDFYLMCQYNSHSFPADTEFNNEYRARWTGTEEAPPNPLDTVSYVQHYLAIFHNNKDTFLKYRASKTVKRDAAVFAAGSVPPLTAEELKKFKTKKEITEKNAELADKRREKKIEYLLEHSTYNMPKVHSCSHFGEAIPAFGGLKQHSTTIVERNHQPLNDAFDRSNKVDAMDQTLRRAGHMDAISVKVANMLAYLQRPPPISITPDEQLARDDMTFWMGIFGSNKAKLAAARANRNRMKPLAATRTAREKAARAERLQCRAMIQQRLMETLGFGPPLDDAPDSDDEGSPSDEDVEEVPLHRDTAPGRLLKGRMLSIKLQGAEQGLMNLGHIQRLLKVEGLVAAFHDLMIKEKVVSRYSSIDLIKFYDASPFMALRIRRPAFQSSHELENHIIRCTAGENFRNREPRADFVVYMPADDGHRPIDNPILGARSVGQVLCFFRAAIPSASGKAGGNLEYGRFAAIRPMAQLPMTPSQLRRVMPRFAWTTTRLTIIRIGAIERAACMVPVLPVLRKTELPESPVELISKATKFVLNTKVDLETFSSLY